VRIKTAKTIYDLPKPYHIEAMAQINRDSPRGAAIAAATFLELLLRNSLEARMVPDPKIHSLLFEDGGALQEFGSRIQMSYALKIIGWRAYTDLGIIKDIRNVFGHSVEDFDFDRQEIAAACARLWFPLHIRYGTGPMPISPREIFTRAVELLADGLAEDIFMLQNSAHCRSLSFLHFGPGKPLPQKPTSPSKRQRRSSPDYPTKTQKIAE
jgi:hypothetical protein